MNNVHKIKPPLEQPSLVHLLPSSQLTVVLEHFLLIVSQMEGKHLSFEGQLISSPVEFVQTVQLGRKTYWQALEREVAAALQESMVQGLPSSQEMGTERQPDEASQVSLVHTLPSVGC